MNNERKVAIEQNRQEIWKEKEKMLKPRISQYYSKLRQIRRESHNKV